MVTYGKVVVSGRCTGGTPKPDMLLEIYRNGSRVASGTTPAAELIIGQVYTLEYNITASGVYTFQGRMVLTNPLASPELWTEQHQHEVGIFRFSLWQLNSGVLYEEGGVVFIEIEEGGTITFFGELDWNEHPAYSHKIFSWIGGKYYGKQGTESGVAWSGLFPMGWSFPTRPRDFNWKTYTWGFIRPDGSIYWSWSKASSEDSDALYAIPLEYTVMLRPLMMLPRSDRVIECSMRPTETRHYKLVDDEPSGNEQHNGDDNYIYNTSTSWEYDLFTSRLTFNDIVLPVHVTDITSIRVNAYVKYGEVKNVIRTHGVQYEGAIQLGGSGYTRRSTTWTVNPYTNQPWTREEVNDLISGVALRKSARCTQIYVSIYQ